jgi:hypothetical protein
MPQSRRFGRERQIIAESFPTGTESAGFAGPGAVRRERSYSAGIEARQSPHDCGTARYLPCRQSEMATSVHVRTGPSARMTANAYCSLALSDFDAST